LALIIRVIQNHTSSPTKLENNWPAWLVIDEGALLFVD